mmetsp:Transcript_40005/g.106140  ORF Transcript_40005/g.106140 Transcript_40005/m.106140 type:complete len:207 (+) Transcript_40005:755-1375(+)
MMIGDCCSECPICRSTKFEEEVSSSSDCGCCCRCPTCPRNLSANRLGVHSPVATSSATAPWKTTGSDEAWISSHRSQLLEFMERRGTWSRLYKGSSRGGACSDDQGQVGGYRDSRVMSIRMDPHLVCVKRQSLETNTKYEATRSTLSRPLQQRGTNARQADANATDRTTNSAGATASVSQLATTSASKRWTNSSEVRRFMILTHNH